MKTTLLNLIVVTSTFSLLACAPGDDAVESDGRCTAETVALHNTIYRRAKLFSTSGSQSYLDGIQNACSSFRSLIGTRSCRAKDESGNEKTVSYGSVRKTCVLANQIDESYRGSTSRNSDSPRTYSNEVKFQRRGFSIQVNDASAINELITSKPTVYIQLGRLIRNSRTLSMQSPYCAFTPGLRKGSVRTGEKLIVPSPEYVRDSEGVLTIVGSGSEFLLGCRKGRSSGWTISQLQEVFGQTARIVEN